VLEACITGQSKPGLIDSLKMTEGREREWSLLARNLVASGHLGVVITYRPLSTMLSIPPRPAPTSLRLAALAYQKVFCIMKRCHSFKH
jgi:hypothetical protein